MVETTVAFWSQSPADWSNFKTLYSELNAQILDSEVESIEQLKPFQLLVVKDQQELFSQQDFDIIRRFVSEGGNLLYITNHTEQAQGNFNYLLEECGISVNKECVISTAIGNCQHPKVVTIVNGSLNNSVPNDFVLVVQKSSTITLQSPAIPLLSSGTLSLPFNRHVCALSFIGNGRVVAFCAASSFDDKNIQTENNHDFFKLLLEFLSGSISADQNHLTQVVSNYDLPNVTFTSELPRVQFQKYPRLPKDVTDLLRLDYKSSGLSRMASLKNLFEELRVPSGKNLLQQHIKVYVPPFKMAVYQPMMKDPEEPPMPQIDLDEELSKSLQ